MLTIFFQVIEIIGKENVNLSDKQVDELIELIDKEEILEVEDKIEKALQKDKEAQEECKNIEASSTDSEVKKKEALQKPEDKSNVSK